MPKIFEGATQWGKASDLPMLGFPGECLIRGQTVPYPCYGVRWGEYTVKVVEWTHSFSLYFTFSDVSTKLAHHDIEDLLTIKLLITHILNHLTSGGNLDELRQTFTV